MTTDPQAAYDEACRISTALDRDRRAIEEARVLADALVKKLADRPYDYALAAAELTRNLLVDAVKTARAKADEADRACMVTYGLLEAGDGGPGTLTPNDL